MHHLLKAFAVLVNDEAYVEVIQIREYIFILKVFLKNPYILSSFVCAQSSRILINDGAYIKMIGISE